MLKLYRSKGQCGLMRGSAASLLLGLWVRIPPETWMYVSCNRCVLSGRGLCDELISRPEESYRLWCVVMCDLENSRKRRASAPQKGKKLNLWVMGLLCCTESDVVIVDLKRRSIRDRWSMRKVSVPDVFVMFITYHSATETAVSFRKVTWYNFRERKMSYSWCLWIRIS
jgi:hypothetical protein